MLQDILEVLFSKESDKLYTSNRFNRFYGEDSFIKPHAHFHINMPFPSYEIKTMIHYYS